MADNKHNLKQVDDSLEHDAFYAQVSELAYLKAEQRGFAEGRELEDWLEAELELRGQHPSEDQPA